jgi:hypothetical protein
MTPEELAQLFHETYERLAPEHNYQTRKASAVPWSDVPENNKNLMIAVAGEVLNAVNKPGEAEAITAFMGWLTSRDEVVGPFSAHHDASQAAQLVGTFCQAQGWTIDDARYLQVIRALKRKYPD